MTRREERVIVNLTPQEKDLIGKVAEDEGLTLAGFFRQKALGACHSQGARDNSERRWGTAPKDEERVK
jgi:hypothetical protein